MVCDPVVDASVLLPVMLRCDTVTEVILPVDLVTGWQLDAGNVTVSIIGIGGKCILPAIHPHGSCCAQQSADPCCLKMNKRQSAVFHNFFKVLNTADTLTKFTRLILRFQIFQEFFDALYYLRI